MILNSGGLLSRRGCVDDSGQWRSPACAVGTLVLWSVEGLVGHAGSPVEEKSCMILGSGGLLHVLLVHWCSGDVEGLVGDGGLLSRRSCG